MLKKDGFIKCECGYYNPATADVCEFCGRPLPNKVKKVILVFDDERKSFPLIRRIKKIGVDIKIFKPNTVMVERIDEVDFLLFDMDANNSRNREIFFKLTHRFKRAEIISFAESDDDIKEWKRMGVDYVLTKISQIDDVLLEDRSKLKLPVYSIKSAENILRSFKGKIKIISFIFEKFDNLTIESVAKLLENIYNDLKRSDAFLVVANFGFIVVPYNQDDNKGIAFLKSKIEDFVLKNSDNRIKLVKSVITVFSSNTILYDLMSKEEGGGIISDAGQAKDSWTIIKKTKYLGPSDPYVLNFALDSLDSNVAALLFFDPEYKKKIDKFLTLRIAKEIGRIKKDGFDSYEIKRAKEEFEESIAKVAESFDISMEREFIESLSSDTQLSSLPEVQTNILMSYSEEIPIKKIVREIQKDPAIASAVLRFANSAFLGLKKEIRDVEKAAIVLGMEEILAIALSVFYLNMFKSKLTKELYRYAIATMDISKYIEKKGGVSSSITLGGVLHVIGNMFYAQFHDAEYKKLAEYVKEKGEKYEKVELRFLPARASEVGYRLAEVWSFPLRIRELIKGWVLPAWFSKVDTSFHLLHVSALMARAMGYFYPGYSIDDINYYSYELFLKKFNVNLIMLFKNDQEKIKEEIEEMLYIIS